MPTLHSLERQRQRLLSEIAGLPPMRKGSLRPIRPTRLRKDGTTVSRGPYWSYTFKEKDKTKGRHIGQQELAQAYRQQIETFRRFQDLSARLVEISQAMADLAVKKKGSSRRSKT